MRILYSYNNIKLKSLEDYCGVKIIILYIENTLITILAIYNIYLICSNLHNIIAWSSFLSSLTCHSNLSINQAISQSIIKKMYISTTGSGYMQYSENEETNLRRWVMTPTWQDRMQNK